ncbi:MAG: ribbon-helix-helix protein, CopG family [Methanomassiliicoccaceae archaeon]|jgi:CopG family nickel-responsive transcriptional regulator|nr:ribbon-helix-helix protein, CopG family [Methanomassiliicoccaceae archaeon]
MAVISVSLSDESMDSLDRIQKGLELAGRSETVRAAINIAESEMENIEDTEGSVEGVLIIVHGTHSDRWIGMLQHKYEGMIKTQLHSHLQSKKCLEVMILAGDPDRFGEMMRELYGTGKADYVKFVRGL